jgi:hypothetical protein
VFLFCVPSESWLLFLINRLLVFFYFCTAFAHAASSLNQSSKAQGSGKTGTKEFQSVAAN